LTLLRRLQQGRPREALWRAVKRNLGLILLGIVLYKLGGQYHTWDELTQPAAVLFLNETFILTPLQALVHIGLTVLSSLPVILAPGWVRVLFAVASGGLHVYLSYAGYYSWNMTSPVGIDGGPLGFLAWTIPLVAGTLAYDVVARPGRGVAGL